MLMTLGRRSDINPRIKDKSASVDFAFNRFVIFPSWLFDPLFQNAAF